MTHMCGRIAQRNACIEHSTSCFQPRWAPQNDQFDCSVIPNLTGSQLHEWAARDPRTTFRPCVNSPSLVQQGQGTVGARHEPARVISGGPPREAASHAVTPPPYKPVDTASNQKHRKARTHERARNRSMEGGKHLSPCWKSGCCQHQERTKQEVSHPDTPKVARN
jgi:hypothetical protein